MTIKKRETNYDLLKILCCFGVIMVHSNSFYSLISSNPLLETLETSLLNKTDSFHIAYNYFFHDCFYFAVPCFMMISGAFLLSNNKNSDFKFFIKKIIKGTLVPTLVFSILYILYYEGRWALGIIFRGHNIWHLINLPYLGKILCGEPVRYLWYMYTLLAICPLVPLIINLKNSLGEEKFRKISNIYIIAALISGWTTDLHLLNWGVSKVACYIGYFLVGYQIRINTKKNTKKGLLYIILGFIIMSIMAYLRYYHTSIGIYNDQYDQEAPFALINLFGPYVATASILIFSGFSKLDLNENTFISNFAIDTFYIYLFHGFVIDIKNEVFMLFKINNYDCVIFIPLLFMFVLLISLLLTKVYKLIWPKINEKYQIDNKILKILRMSE